MLFLISFSLTTPLLLAGPDSKIAACCRRDGKHHCAKMAAEASHTDEASGTVRVTATATCPLFNGGKGAPATTGAAVTPPAPFAFFTLAVQIAKAPQAEAQGRISKSRSAQKRGPPALLA